MATITRCDGVLFRRSMLGSLTWLTDNRDKINQLNVFPVPDGDTGTNMALTLEAVVAELDGAGDMQSTCKAISHGSLMGARFSCTRDHVKCSRTGVCTPRALC